MTAFTDTVEVSELLNHVPPADDAHRVEYRFTCQDLADDFVVAGFSGQEELNSPYHFTIHLETCHEAGDATVLLGRSAIFALEREEQIRAFRGIVARVTTHDRERNGQSSTVELVPALHALRLVEDTRIFQEKSALEIVEIVLSERLGLYGRTIDTSSVDRERYPTRDYCVQYRETSFAFVHRLLEEEGIGYYFRHDEGSAETLVLFDDNADLTRVHTMDKGPVRFDPARRAWAGSEPIVGFGGSIELTPSKVTVRDHDWTHPRPTVEAAFEGRRDQVAMGGHSHEIYEHGFERQLTIHEDNSLLTSALTMAVQAAMPFGPPAGLAHMVHDLPGMVLGAFTSSNATQQAGIRLQRAQRNASRFHGVGVVTSFAPGCTFDLVGHPTLGADGTYLLTKVVHTSSPSEPIREEDAGANTSGNYENAFECLPLGIPWRPDRRTRKPRIYGVQTGRVTGPLGMDVHTDPYGRVKVRFHWDRAGEDHSGHYTCWLRVGQTWAGNGSPGFMFLPRIGMEVIISFVDGDPDRPLVTGCVYNGANATPGLLPVQATKSIIRTRTVPHGPGHNEISFEDAMGMERVHIRAQRDLDELVLNDHLTTVSGEQFNTVGGDQVETVMRHQRVHVDGHRVVRVSGNHSIASQSDLDLDVGGSANTQVTGDYEVAIDEGSALIDVRTGGCLVSARAPITLVQDGERFIELSSSGDDRGIELNSDGASIRITQDAIELKIGRSLIRMSADVIQVNNKTFPAG